MTAAQPAIDARPSPIAGQWYPGDAATLTQTIDHMLETAEAPKIQKRMGRIVGILAPHAGIRYSGQVAAHAFKLVRDLGITRVVILSPMHHVYHTPVLTTAHACYRTPLGDVPVDRETLEILAKQVSLEAVREDPEHSLEIELPFLQRTLGEFALVPLMLREQSLSLAKQLGEALAEALRPEEDFLLVASSDLSHFYSQEEAASLDSAMLRQVEAFDPEGVIRTDEQGKGFACGRGAIATMLIAARALGADSAQVVKYATSGDISGDYSRVVGYGAAVVYQAAA
jgi:AmmeMemoRadiSam system protein B